ncbi:MAG TPA: endosialidase [Lachnospiraceae bacterium]|nr:endosialidase [Eubacterium sp.]HBZ02704.1 endosialidase [Lachnospiraceae bacterium]
MAVIDELIREEENGSLSFGNYELTSKTKKDGFEYNGDSYKIKTFNEITKLERNGMFVYESVPGTVVHEFRADDKKVTFTVEGEADAQITLELEAEAEYKVHVDDVYVGQMKTNLGGKLSLSVELEDKDLINVVIEKN